MSHLLEVSIAYRHCVKSVCIRSHSGPHFSTFSLIWTEYEEIDWIHIYSKCGKCGKMRTRITPNTDTFYVVRGIFRSVQYILMEFCKNTSIMDLWLFPKYASTCFGDCFTPPLDITHIEPVKIKQSKAFFQWNS